jgi:enoyl-CoA hydratase/carnithine racemase
VTVRVHGDCIGAGLELPAFAGRVVAAPASRFRLPETAMGLVPGAGGTVSLPRRIGRARTAWLALSGEAINAGTALRWGLVDVVE